MVQPNTLTFLANLAANNNKAWFEANRAAYEAAKDDFTRLVTYLIDALQTADPELAQTPLQAKDCVYRMYRDTRFSGDKSPYKTNFAAWINKGGKKANTAGYYVNIEPGKCFVAGGIYQPEPEWLARVRQEIDYNFEAFRGLMAEPAFAEYFADLSREGALQRVPKGYDEANPAAAYLKLKSFTAQHNFPDTVAFQPNCAEHLATVLKALQPLNTYLNQGVEV